MTIKTTISTHRPHVSLGLRSADDVTINCWWRHICIPRHNNCDARTRKTIYNTLDIDFIHNHVHVWSLGRTTHMYLYIRYFCKKIVFFNIYIYFNSSYGINNIAWLDIKAETNLATFFKSIFVKIQFGILVRISLMFCSQGPNRQFSLVSSKGLANKQATNHFLNKWWSNSPKLICVSWPKCVKLCWHAHFYFRQLLEKFKFSVW